MPIVLASVLIAVILTDIGLEPDEAPPASDGWLLVEGRTPHPPGLTQSRCSTGAGVGKLNNTREALKIARTSRAILGANGITPEYPIMRHMTNLESVLTYEGTEEVTRS